MAQYDDDDDHDHDGDDDHDVCQFHAHWGGEDSRGSEHTVDGKVNIIFIIIVIIIIVIIIFDIIIIIIIIVSSLQAFASEIHLVHFNQKYGNIETAIDKVLKCSFVKYAGLTSPRTIRS